jgi:hypothetical protein
MAMRLVKVLGQIATSISTSNAPIQFEALQRIDFGASYFNCSK